MRPYCILNKNLIMHPQSVVWTINSHRALLIVVARNDVSVLVCFVKVNNRDQVTAFGWLEILSSTFYVVSTKGQLISKANCQAVNSAKKTNN